MWINYRVHRKMKKKCKFQIKVNKFTQKDCLKVCSMHCIVHPSTFIFVLRLHVGVFQTVLKCFVTGLERRVNTKTAHREIPAVARHFACSALLSRNCRLISLAGQSRVLVIGFTVVPAGSGLTSYTFINWNIKQKENYLCMRGKQAHSLLTANQPIE